MGRRLLAIKLLIDHGQHLSSVRICRGPGRFQSCLGCGGVHDFKRGSAIGLLCNFEIPNHGGTSDSVLTTTVDHPKKFVS